MMKNRQMFAAIPALIFLMIFTTTRFGYAAGDDARTMAQASAPSSNAQSSLAATRAGSLSLSSSLPTSSRALTSPVFGANGRIVFASTRDGNHEIYVMDADGNHQTRLTNHPAYDDQPCWSPDSTKIAFISARDGNFEVYSMNADGSSQTRLTNNPAGDGFPAWSPDGTKIAFVNGNLNDATTFEIYVMNADGSNRTRLTNNSVMDGVPAWSPDGTKIAFMSGSSLFDPNNFEIYVMDANGSNRTRLTNNSIADGQPTWSPDGTKILFASGDAMNPPGVEIYVMNANGSNRTRLTNNSVTDGFPAWSPDGAKIIFARGNIADETSVELYVMNADGSNQTRLTNNSALDWFPNFGVATFVPNPIDDARTFVRQHYLDFLGREPDQGGWDYWTDRITQCGTDQQCVHNRRVEVSAAFYIELEFQVTGSVIYRVYRASYGVLQSDPLIANISYAQFSADRPLLVAGPQLPQSTIDYVNQFVQRPQFKSAYPDTMSNTEFVNKLYDTAGLVPYTAERQQQITAMNGGKTRAQVLLDVIEIQEFKNREYNRAFVLMQYFGYLRRDADTGGYDFWLDVLTRLPAPNNFRNMVCAFITSSEYQLRFGQTITRHNSDCASN